MINLMLQNSQPVIYDGEQQDHFQMLMIVYFTDKLLMIKILHLKSSTLDQMKIIFQ